MARNYPNICINSVDPGFVKTDMNFNTGMLTIDEGAESVVRLAMVPNGSASTSVYNKSHPFEHNKPFSIA